jgi:hypothetical protein
MIVLKDVPGLSDTDILQAVSDLGVQLRTGSGGVVVDETTALSFLYAYCAMTNTLPSFLDDMRRQARSARETQVASMEPDQPHAPSSVADSTTKTTTQVRPNPGRKTTKGSRA